MSNKPIQRMILCGPVSQKRLPYRDPNPLVLSVYGEDPNVRVEYARFVERFCGTVNTVLVDFLSIAAYVYTADQSISRGDAEDNRFGNAWRRSLFFRIAVRHPEVWNRPEIREELTSTLSFMSDDEYHVEFAQDDSRTPWRPTIQFDETNKGGDIDDVMLFSGGLDSLAGAIQAACGDGKKMFWVRHVSTTKYQGAVERLATDLNSSLSRKKGVFLPVKINKPQKLSVEPIRRTRTMLFAALAAYPADDLGKNRLYFYENGVVSLNLPPASQVVGARATRTTHPRVLNGLSRLLSLLLNRSFRVENPFIWKTRADVVKLIEQYGFQRLIAQTVSCASTYVGAENQPHCGVCSQCIDRRFALLATGLESSDRAGDYQTDFLHDIGDKPLAQTMLAVYAETARVVEQMTSPYQFLARYGEAIRVLSEFDQTPEVTLSQIMDLYRRHGQAVGRVIDQQLTRCASRIRNREVNSRSLVGMVVDRATEHRVIAMSTQPPVSMAENQFRRQGRGYVVRFQGRHEYYLPNRRGFAYLHQLLAAPCRPISAVNLLHSVVKEEWLLTLGSGSRTNNEDDAKETYRIMLQEIDDEIAEAKSQGDEETLHQLEERRDVIMSEINHHFRKDGLPRAVNDDLDRVRKSVSKAIKEAIRFIANEDALLHQHLQKPTIQTGKQCRYAPPEEICWETD